MTNPFLPSIVLPAETIEHLIRLAKRSLESNDVPVAALLLYEGKVIGEGYNTVLRNSDAGGHAEINAISDALRSLGVERFAALDRSHLTLVSTFEPCLMCIGACINHRIPTVHYLQPKTIADLLKERKAEAMHFIRRRKVLDQGIQLELFRLHPDFKHQSGYSQ
ncbi:MAG: nucleoside deaminase [Bacteroidetes bacterium]|nr:nucleoside deaminase [Bacteroidota bacterium]